MAIPTRELAITYGSYSVGGSNANALLDGQYTLDKRDDAFTLQFSFLVIGGIGTNWTEAQFATACGNAEDAFRKPFVDLSIVQGSATILDLKQSTGKGLEVHAEIIKAEHPANTGRSRRYTVRITGGLPADNRSGDDVYLRDLTVTVTGGPSKRRVVTMSGVYTNNGATGARATYAANVTTKASSIITGLGGGPFELIGTPREEASFHDQTLTFSRTYQEVLFGQAGSTTDAAIVDQVFTLTKRRYSERNAPPVTGLPTGASAGSTSDTGGAGSTGDVQPLVQVTADWAASIDFSVTTDLDATWKRVKSWAIAQIQTALGTGGFALTEDAPVRNPDNNRVSGRLVALGIDAGGSGVIRREYEDTIDIVTGRTLVPAWASDPETYFDYQGPKARTRTRRLVEDKAGASSATPSSSSGSVGSSAFGFGSGSGSSSASAINGASPSGWVLLRGPSVSTFPTTIGLDGRTLSIIRTTTTWVEQYRVPAKARGGSGAVTPS